MLCELVFQLRTCEIMSGRENRPENKRMFEKELKYSVSKAVFYNIEVMSSYLSKNIKQVAKIVNKMDPSYSNSIIW